VSDAPARLVLASGSTARRDMLAGAGVPFSIRIPDVDEETVKAGHDPGDPEGLAIALAQLKALSISTRDRDAWVLGADQTLAFAGTLVSKARSMNEARMRLLAMRGEAHRLHSAAAIAHQGRIVWSGVDTAVMRVRDFSDAFLDTYLHAEGNGLLACVGSYRLEGMGPQLFDAVEGDYFTVLGLPLWPVLEQLRRAGILTS